MPKRRQQYFFEVTDTFAGEPNYAWVRRYLVQAQSVLGAIRKLAREAGLSGRLQKDLDTGESQSWRVRGAAMCVLGCCSDGREAELYLHVKTL